MSAAKKGVTVLKKVVEQSAKIQPPGYCLPLDVAKAPPPKPTIFRRVLNFSNKYPLSRGMASYAIIWPIGSLVQQHLEGKGPVDYKRVLRYFLYGTFYVAPTLNVWMKIAQSIWPNSTITSAITKAVVEQFTYTPFAMASFYFGMTILEGKSIQRARNEVAEKFLPTYKVLLLFNLALAIAIPPAYKVGICVWPVIQAVNYTVVPVKNRIPFVSVFSLLWTTFLAYMKHLDARDFNKPRNIPMEHEKIALSKQLEEEKLKQQGQKKK